MADTGNHRVQRFLDNGALDISWGLQGVVGTTGVVKRDHSGFDRPMDVAVNPLNQNVYVADYGNCRLEVFNSSGQYLRSFIAVYHPNALAFAPNGDLFIAGEDPNENYPSYDGRLRLLKAGDELSSRHFSGGLDDLERQLTGVCVTPDSSIIVSDPMNRRLVRTDLDFAVPLDSLQVSATGTVVQIKWKTRVAARGSLRFGASSAVTSRLDEAQTGNEHSLTINGLTPNSRLYYSLGFADSFDGQTRWTPVDVINTGCAPGQHQFLRLKAAGLIYTDTQAGSGYKAMSAADLAAARARFQKVAQFYWRNSGFKVWPDIQIIELNRDITESSYNVWNSAENDLAALGYGPADNFDAVWAASPQAGGNFGGGGSLFGRSVAMCEWCTADDFVAIHEINHTLDSMYDLCGLPKYQFNHGTWAVAGGVGQGFALNGQILRNMLPQNLTATVAPYTKIMTAPDADNDGLPDSSPAGLLNPLAVTEATLGSSTTSSDTDGDGVSDRAEAMLLIAHGSNLLATDSDQDGVADGNDLNPAYRMQDQILKATPLIDGTITPGEGWTVMTRNWGFTNELLVTDPNHLQRQVTTYAAWDDHFFYLAMKGPGCSSTISLDGSADGWGFGPDNYRLTLNNSVDSKSVKINVGVPDLFRQIDDDGQYGEFYDTDPQWKLPYQGRYFYDKPTEGAGATGRLVTEADLNYRRGGTGTNQVWEVAIPWSSKTAFRGSAGKLLAINWDVDGDVLFETDHAARLKLVTSPLPANPSVTYSRRATTVRWTAVPGIRYQVCTAESLQGPWRYLTDLVGQGDNTSFTDDGLLSGSARENNLTRFYSLRPSP